MKSIFQNLSEKHSLRKVSPRRDKGLNSKTIRHGDLNSLVTNLIQEQGIFSWRVPEENWYSGLGLTYTPNRNEDSQIQVLGNWGSSDYDCGMQFYKVQEWAKPIFELVNLPLTPIRSRIAIADGKVYMPPKAGWHIDESPYETLRLNIPIRTNPNFYFQLDNCLPEHLPTGRAYWWDTQIPHRVYHKQNSSIRIHLVLGFSPWFMLKDSEWIPNEFFNRVHPLDIPYETL